MSGIQLNLDSSYLVFRCSLLSLNTLFSILKKFCFILFYFCCRSGSTHSLATLSANQVPTEEGGEGDEEQTEETRYTQHTKYKLSKFYLEPLKFGKWQRTKLYVTFYR